MVILERRGRTGPEPRPVSIHCELRSRTLREGTAIAARASALRYATVLLGLLLALVINHHWFYPDFNLVPGDRGDTRLVIFTLEHWFSAFKGQEPMLVLNMFYPDRVALGYADGLFLFALPYAALQGHWLRLLHKLSSCSSFA